MINKCRLIQVTEIFGIDSENFHWAPFHHLYVALTSDKDDENATNAFIKILKQCVCKSSGFSQITSLVTNLPKLELQRLLLSISPLKRSSLPRC